MNQPAGRLRWLSLVISGGTVLGFGLVSGVAFDRVLLGVDVPPNAAADFRLMAEAWTTIGSSYVDRSAVQGGALTYGAISGMVGSLGDTGHSTFLSPEMVKVTENLEQGKLQGIGVEISAKQGRVVVVAPLDGSPAQRAGLRPGDVILEVDGHPVTGKPLGETVGRIAGPPGTRVTLRLLSPDRASVRTLTLERASIKLHGVTWQRLPETRLAHVRISRFSYGVAEDLRQALGIIARERLAGLILDLRDDPGGLLEEAVGVASQFLEHGTVLVETNARGAMRMVPVRPGGGAPTIPLVTLINGGTASAAEIVAAALKDAGRARLVGETTFGTGTVLSEFPLSDGSALMLATGEWLTPKGHVIWHRGIAPDRVVKLPDDVRPHWPEAKGTLSGDQLEATKDDQLRAAVELLTQRDASH